MSFWASFSIWFIGSHFEPVTWKGRDGSHFCVSFIILFCLYNCRAISTGSLNPVLKCSFHWECPDMKGCTTRKWVIELILSPIGKVARQLHCEGVSTNSSMQLQSPWVLGVCGIKGSALECPEPSNLWMGLKYIHYSDLSFPCAFFQAPFLLLL